jgi:hypothetical protein
MKLASGLEIKSIPDLSHLAFVGDAKALWVKWIEALRSGKYHQVKTSLKTEEGHCCLGVACEIAAAAGFASWIQYCGEFLAVDSNGSSSQGSLPFGIYSGYGIKDSYALSIRVEYNLMSNYRHFINLADLNDSYAATFEEIADILETAINGGYSLAKDPS